MRKKKQIEITKDTQVYVIPTGDKIRVCIDHESLWKPMTINAYMNMIAGCLDAIQEIRREEKFCKCKE